MCYPPEDPPVRRPSFAAWAVFVVVVESFLVALDAPVVTVLVLGVLLWIIYAVRRWWV